MSDKKKTLLDALTILQEKHRSASLHAPTSEEMSRERMQFLIVTDAMNRALHGPLAMKFSQT